MNIIPVICILEVACVCGCANRQVPAVPPQRMHDNETMLGARLQPSYGGVTVSNNVEIEFPPTIVIGSPVQVRVTIRNISSEKQCLTVDSIRIVRQSIALLPSQNSGAISIDGTEENAGAPDFGIVDRNEIQDHPNSCFVASRRIELESGEQVRLALTLSPFQQSPGHGEVAVVLDIPIFGSECRCGSLSNRAKVEKRAPVEIVAGPKDASGAPRATKGSS